MTFRDLMINSGVKPQAGENDYSRWRGCIRKRRYSLFSEAKAAADRTNHGKVYGPCEHCFGYHVGHSNEQS